MATQVQFRGGTTSEHSTFTGVAREVTVDTTKKTVVVHDGSTAGGIPLAKESAVTSAAAITGGSINGTTVGASTASTGAFTTLSASSTVSGTGFSTYLASPPAIGGTTASTGRFTTVTATGLTTGRVVTTSNSGLLTDSSNFTWDTNTLNILSPSNSPINLSSSSTSNTLIQLTNANAAKDLISRFRQNAGGGTWWDLTMEGSTNDFTFEYNDGEKFRITNAGNLLVGDTSYTTSKFRVLQSASEYTSRLQNSNASPVGLSIYYSGASPNGTGNSFIVAEDNTALRFEVRSNGGIANYTANNVILSDSREKTNFTPATSYLDKICAIPVQTFNYIDQNLEEDNGLTLGVVAQDVQAVAPELVSEGNWGTEEKPKMRLEIYQTDLQYAIMKALQELKAEFDAYKATHP